MGKNNKKKNKGKPKGLAAGNGETSLPDNGDTASEQSYQKQNLSDGESQSVGFQESDVDAEKRMDNGVDEERNIKLLEEQKVAWSKAEPGYQEELRRLKGEILNCIQKELNLEETIEQLQSERDFFLQKEVDWKTKLEGLQSQVNSCLLEEALLKEHLRTLGEESSRKEESGKEETLRLENANSLLQAQVNELVESRDRLVQENQLLINSISDLQVRIQQLEATTIAEAKAKVNESHNGASHSYSSSVNDSREEYSPSSKQEKEMQANQLQGQDDSSGQAFESIPIHDAANVLNDSSAPLDANRSVVLAQLPLEDEIQVEEEVVAGNAIQEPNVPLSDAPLIGAPFRFVSFVAKYVSGADLVKQPGSKIDR